MKTVVLFDLDFISDQDYDAVIEEVLDWKEGSSTKLPLLITPNVDQIVKMHRSENGYISNLLSEAQWVLPDGQPLVWLSKVIYGGNALQKRLTGSDFFPLIWKSIQATGRKVFFVVPNEALGLRFKEEYKGSNYYCPPFFSVYNPEERDEQFAKVMEAISSFKPDFLFIGLGFPKQELMASFLLDRLYSTNATPPVTMLLGASFEFYFGTKKRAPKVFQKLGLEFLHRLLSEPKRMFKRYLVDDLAFFPLAFKEYNRRKKKA